MNKARKLQRGASLVELTIVLPTLMTTVLGIWQSALVFHAKSHLNYATFEAARAGSTAHASVASVTEGLAKGLVAYYGGGLSSAELAQRYAEVSADVAQGARVEFISPVRESFDDYDSPALRQRLGVQARAIPNLGIGYMKCPHDRPDCAADPATNGSGQTLADANLLKPRITYGIPAAKQLPLVGRFYTWALDVAGAGSGDTFKQQLIDDGRIPLVSHVTLRMQSEPIEHAAIVSRDGTANPGEPQDPGTTAPPAAPPPASENPGSQQPEPGDHSGSDPGHHDGGPPPDSGTPPPGHTPPAECADDADISETLASDILFEFDSAQLSPAGQARLDQLIKEAEDLEFTSLDVTGHTDPLGTDAHNDALSLQRADAVRAYLQANGFPDKPITTSGRGSRDAVMGLDACPEEHQARIECLMPNRRVTVTWQR